jgi:hypothetical protein
MSVVIVDNKEIELDIYGRIPGAEVITHIGTSLGLVECRLRVILYEGALVFDADLWQGGDDLLNKITLFRAGVYMRWEGNRYRIINKSYRDYNNLWRELEVVVSNWIMCNV